MRAGDCSIVVAHWQNTGKSGILGSIPGECRPLNFFLLLLPHHTFNSLLPEHLGVQFKLVH